MYVTAFLFLFINTSYDGRIKSFAKYTGLWPWGWRYLAIYCLGRPSLIEYLHCWQILGPDSGWQSIPLTDILAAAAVKKAYRKATLCVHPDKLQQRGATIQQKYICEKVFDLLKVCCFPSLTKAFIDLFLFISYIELGKQDNKRLNYRICPCSLI